MLVSEIPSFPAASALGPYLRVKTASGLALAGASDDELGTLNQRVLATGDMASVLPREYPGVRLMVANGSFAQFSEVYAAASGKVASTGTLLRGIALEASGGDGAVIRVMTANASLVGDVARSQLTQDANVVHSISLFDVRTPAGAAVLGASAGTPSGALGLTPGTHGSATPILAGEAASGNVKTDSGRFLFTLPDGYDDGQSVTVRVRAKMATALTVGATVDVLCFKSDLGGGVGSDICATAAKSITDAYANYDFTITPTGLVRGDVLDILITAVATDTGGTVNAAVNIGAIQVLLDLKG